MKKIIFHKNEDVTVKDLLTDNSDRMKLCSNILLHYTNITRDADNILSAQKKNNKTVFLNSIAELVCDLEEAFLKKDFERLGPLLKINWELKKQLAEGITLPEIDLMTQKAEASGATGFKIAGAGGGGFLMSYVPRIHQDEFRRAMHVYRELPFMFDSYGSRIIFNIQK